MRVNERTEENSEVVQLENLRDEQWKDGELKLIIEWIEDPTKVPGIDELRTRSPEVQQLWVQHQNLEIQDRILYRKFVKPDGSLQYWQIVVPKSLRMAFLDVVHSGAWNGHPVIERTRLKLQEIAYWRSWTTDTHAYVQRCLVCATHRPGPQRKQGQMRVRRHATLCKKSMLT